MAKDCANCKVSGFLSGAAGTVMTVDSGSARRARPTKKAKCEPIL
jgi:hypothetical protein